MKRYRFNLERVRQFRHGQMELEEAALRRLFAELEGIRARQARLARQVEAEAAVVRSAEVRAEQLSFLDAFREFAKAEAGRLAGEERACRERIDRQRERLVEARRAYRLLEKLRERGWAEWQAEFDRELENQAGELYLAQWPRRRA